MAVCKIRSIHRWKGKTARQTFFTSIAYALNPKKTTFTGEDGRERILVESYACAKDAGRAADEWDVLKDLYAVSTGRKQGANDVLACGIIQSFAPTDGINPELANKIGYEMAKELREKIGGAAPRTLPSLLRRRKPAATK